MSAKSAIIFSCSARQNSRAGYCYFTE